ncbi:MAG: aerotolerance regulator BatC [Bacteroides sp.]|nr:hypothetical protein [Roseburia sp.]MCM1346038.1 aerotolerance regulator BatC [Bacteroides sp.]MCM1420199.1 aerotolerance regulator BatC [Bacteroides sp.]
MKIMINRYLLVVVWAMIACSSLAQTTDRDYLRLGNRYYREGLYSKAETYYLKAIDKKPTLEAYYNAGNALVMQGQDSTAFEMYKNAAGMSTGNKMKKAQIYHNMGNLMYANGCALMKSGKDAGSALRQAVDFYKSSLRCNPSDNETRYNLAKALYLLKNGSSGGGGGDDENEQNQNKEEQEKNQPQQEQNENKEDKQQEDKNNISDEAAEQLLNSAQQDEKNVQRKINQNPNNKRRSLDKDW